MKTSYATTALCLAIFTMALVPTTDAKASGVRGNRPLEGAHERVLSSKGSKSGGGKTDKETGDEPSSKGTVKSPASQKKAKSKNKDSRK
jgi:hypothetical protein